ncbi:HypC/HybG/HupF family hydrogenase formation chaperone [Blastopirellula sp. JC732]|uniref:HypC/HybG/HupF family hydrogenase formation chaperone n=1 Tax=Blastopirellula sediminis TaxID=2894196 RepID=A0A9X1MKL9_9BACT|nr:HypC/HybG/HupF family hydrogenase formation chaperone [Blastopirellula sediminis]MCC9608340.1 HypC/HybG/HupF family hydrogenase formation chaperone [Blastopirellula sediminis]MCC9628883.1 HypC/HybG/HupF family hydrogenase formation chaperone [Blastopirellula sediminis]
MCLAVPGKIVRWIERTSPFESAAVEFGGVSREVSMACVPGASVGDYVLVHAGIAISVVSANEAERLLRTFAELDGEEPAP